MSTSTTSKITTAATARSRTARGARQRRRTTAEDHHDEHDQHDEHGEQEQHHGGGDSGDLYNQQPRISTSMGTPTADSSVDSREFDSSVDFCTTGEPERFRRFLRKRSKHVLRDFPDDLSGIHFKFPQWELENGLLSEF